MNVTWMSARLTSLVVDVSMTMSSTTNRAIVVGVPGHAFILRAQGSLRSRLNRLLGSLTTRQPEWIDAPANG